MKSRFKESATIEIPDEFADEWHEVDVRCDSCGETFSENTYVILTKQERCVEVECIGCDFSAEEEPVGEGSPCLVGHISTDRTPSRLAKLKAKVSQFLYLTAALSLAVYFIPMALWKLSV